MGDADEEIKFAADEPEPDEAQPIIPVAPWKVLIVDDEPQVHAVTTLVLQDFQFDGRGVQFISAFSGAEGKQMLLQHPDTAVIFLDVVMETEHAGLDLVRTIRGELNNQHARIILRTGQPGQAPENRIILDYDINDYKEKSELTAQKLFTCMVASLRAYKDLATIEASRRGLEKIIIASASLFQQHSMEMFLSGVLLQLGSLLGAGVDAVMATMRSDGPRPANIGLDDLQIVAASGRFANSVNRWVTTALPAEIQTHLAQVVQKRESIYRTRYSVVYFTSRRQRTTLVYIETERQLNPVDHNLIRLFCTNASIGLDNLH